MNSASAPCVLTIAGSDSIGGAGIQADLKTFTAHNVYGSSVITALTAQNTVGVQSVHIPPLSFIESQLTSVLSDVRYSAVKTGMLPSAEIVNLINRKLPKSIPLVIDPVMVATTGASLTPQDDPVWYTAMCELMQRATLITPNLSEASRLLDNTPITNTTGVRDAARQIAEKHNISAVLVKGGHFPVPTQADLTETFADRSVATDILWDGTSYHAFTKPRIESANTHGTGCTLSAAITANLARGEPLPSAVRNAKTYVHGAIAHGFAPGCGVGVLSFSNVTNSKGN